jgi:DNA-binding transcriptional MerR regulator
MPRDSSVHDQDKLDEILTLLRNQGSDIAETKKMLADSQAKVTKLETKVAALEKEVKKLKETSNDREQAAKSRTIRLFGYASTEEETRTTDGGKSFNNKLYDRIIKPCLNTAKTNGDIQSTPQFSTAIEKIFRAGKSSNPARPAPIIITFTSDTYRLAVLRNKKSSLPAPSTPERDAGIRRYLVVEDLTPANYNMLKTLQQREEVDKAWTIEGRIRYTMRGDSTVRRVKSVFDPVENILNG